MIIPAMAPALLGASFAYFVGVYHRRVNLRDNVNTAWANNDARRRAMTSRPSDRIPA